MAVCLSTHSHFKSEFMPGQRVRCSSRQLHLTDAHILKALRAKPRGPRLNEKQLLSSRSPSAAEGGSQPGVAAWGSLWAHVQESQRKPPRGWRSVGARATNRDGVGRVCPGPCLPALPASGPVPQLRRGQWGDAHALSPDPHPPAGPAPAGRRQEKKGESVCGDHGGLWWRPVRGSGMGLQPECVSAQGRAAGRLFTLGHRGRADAAGQGLVGTHRSEQRPQALSARGYQPRPGA